MLTKLPGAGICRGFLFHNETRINEGKSSLFDSRRSVIISWEQ